MISKKELLNEMKISYGQLYRWKREGLIPDEWFIKQSVSTGQETYFKKSLIIPRIKKILELKDDYQLEELKAFLNPNLSEREFSLRDIILIEEIDPFILKYYSKQKEVFSIYDVIIIYIFSTNKDLIDYNKYIEYNFDNIHTINSKFVIIKGEPNKIIILSGDVIFDNEFEIIKSINFEDIASIIAKKI